MVATIRKIAWKLLGNRFYDFLKYKNETNLKDAVWVKIGKYSYDNGAVVWRWFEGSQLHIGNYCSIAAHVNFICDSGYHTESTITTFPFFHEMMSKNETVNLKGHTVKVADISTRIAPAKSGITVGNDVWIGFGATLLPGITIGNGVTILPGAVVADSVPDYAVVGGVPAKIISMKHEPAVIKQLLQIRWWDWSEEKLKSNVHDFYLPISAFIEKHR